MNLSQQSQWKDQVLSEVLHAISHDQELKQALIFKGARILNLHLKTHRQSLDIDSSMDMAFYAELPDLEEAAAWFGGHLEQALHRYFESQDPVRYTLESVTIRRNPPKIPHPRGWDMLVANLKVTDHLQESIRQPTVSLEIAAPEALGPTAVCQLAIDGSSIRAYTLHRIAGEKLRAFLTSLPEYRAKVGGGERVPRVKDLYDLCRIVEARPLPDADFWRRAAAEFRLACQSRYVDCAGPATFRQDWDAVRQSYQNDPSLTEVPWKKADSALTSLLHFLTELDLFPLSFPL